MDIMRMDSIDQMSGLDGSQNLDPGKIFVGGLSWQTTNESLRQYFSQFGEVVDCMVMKDQTTKRSRGFGFVNFADPNSVEKVLASGPHDIDAKRVDPKKSFPRPKLADGQTKYVTRTKKMFVGGLSASTTIEDVKKYFEQFGKVEDAMLMYDKQTQRHRGFAFVTFEREETVDKVVELHYHDINNKTVECKKAQPKSLMDPPTVKGVIPVSLTPVLATACGRAGFPIPGLPQYYAAYTGLPYGYLTTGTATTALGGSDRLLAAAASAGGTTYFATTATPGDYQPQSATAAGPGLGILQQLTARTGTSAIAGIGVSAAGMAPPMSPPATMQPQRADHQYVVQRMVQGQAATGQCQSVTGGGAITSRGLLALQDYTGGDYTLVNGYAGTTFSPMSPVHNGQGFSQTTGPGTLFQLGMPAAAFPAAALASIHSSYQ